MATLTEAFREKQKIIEDIIEKSDKLKEYAERVDEFLTQADEENAAGKLAHILAFENIQPRIKDIVANSVLESCIRSYEFNHPLYIEHLITATILNLEKLIVLEDSKIGFINVKVDLTPLGRIEEWGQAIQAVRSQFGWGKSRGVKIEDSEIDLASKKWREIFLAAREGKPAFKMSLRKDKKTGKEKKVKIDQTEKLASKYEPTIAARLTAIGEKKAPYWYIIEHGNSTNMPGFTTGGTPFPTVNPSKMTAIMSNQIESVFSQVFEEYKKIAEELLLEEMYKEVGAKRKAKSFKYLEKELVDEIEGILTRDKPPQIDITRTGVRVLKEITDAYVRITQKDTFVAQPRIRGRFGPVRKK